MATHPKIALTIARIPLGSTISMKSRVSIPIGVKIFGVASSMLALLLGVTYLSYVRIRQVNRELTNIAAYLTPITKDIAEINIHVLEQEIHFERTVRYYETEPRNPARIAAEIITFEERGELVDIEIAATRALADEALENAYKTEDVLEIVRIRPLLTILEEDHQRLHEHSVEILTLLESGEFAEAEILNRQLEEFKDDFDARLQAVLFELTEFIEHAAREVEAHERSTLAISWWLAGIASVVGLTFAAVVTAGLVRPVRRLLSETHAVEQGNLDVELPVYSTDEVGKLTDSFNIMVRDLREKKRLKATFGQYVDPRIVETLLDQQTSSQGGQRQMMTMFFSDIAGFSSLSELLTPAKLVTLLNQYLTLASVPIQEHRGVLNQFIGDAVSAFWGPPFVEPDDHAKLACFAALEQFDQLAKLQRNLPDLLGIRKGLPDINIRIGLASGAMVAGNIGSENFKSYTVMGPAVHQAETLEEANKRYGTCILLTAQTRALIGDTFETREIDTVELLPGTGPEPIFELLGVAGSTEPLLLELRDRFVVALTAYRQQCWSEATVKFLACLELAPHDGPANYYLSRAQSESAQLTGQAAHSS